MMMQHDPQATTTDNWRGSRNRQDYSPKRCLSSSLFSGASHRTLYTIHSTTTSSRRSHPLVLVFDFIMRKLLRSLRSSSSLSLLRPRPSSSGDGDEVEQEQVRISRNSVDASQFEDSNHEEEEEIQKNTKLIAKTRCSSNNDNTPASTAKKAQSTDEDLAHMSLEQLMRITKQDTKKERRYKYKQSFVRNNAVMVSLQQQKRPMLSFLLCLTLFHSISLRFFSSWQTVTKEDIALNQENDGEEEEGAELNFDSDLYKGSLTIPRSNHSTVPNCCVVCLEEYQTGERVVWSHQCEHAFHRECIVKYFDKIQRKVADTPCPCCRATYTDLTVEIRAKNRASRRRRIQTTTGAIIAGIPWFRRNWSWKAVMASKWVSNMLVVIIAWLEWIIDTIMKSNHPTFRFSDELTIICRTN